MTPEDRTTERSPVYDVSDAICREFVLGVAKADRDEHRDIYTDGQKNVHTTHEDQTVRQSERRITRESVSFDFVHQYYDALENE